MLQYLFSTTNKIRLEQLCSSQLGVVGRREYRYLSDNQSYFDLGLNDIEWQWLQHTK